MLDQNPLAIPVENLAEVQVLMTIKEDEVIYKKD